LRRTLCLAIALLCTGCASRTVPPFRSDPAGAALLDSWQDRAAQSHTLALLARVEYRTPEGARSFTLELFVQSPDTYLLRGRGTLGITGFRAVLSGESLTVLLNRQNRGYTGDPDAYPGKATRELWRMLSAALPWLTGVAALDRADHGTLWQVEVAEDGTRPRRLKITDGGHTLQMQYRRYRDEYPYWHLQSAQGESAEGSMKLEFRQQLFNVELDPALFELVLPPGTLPLVD